MIVTGTMEDRLLNEETWNGIFCQSFRFRISEEIYMANIRSSQIMFHLVLKISISLTTLIILIHVYIVFFKVLKKKVFGESRDFL